MDYHDTIPVTDRVTAANRPTPSVTSQEIDTEAFRRIDAAYPPQVRDFLIIQGIRLLFKGQPNWTAQDTQGAQRFNDLWTAMKAIKNAADALKALTPIPLDYADNTHWPA